MEEKIDNTEQFTVVLTYNDDDPKNKETWYFSSHERAEDFAKTVFTSIRDMNSFPNVVDITLYYAGIRWQSWPALRGNHGEE